jgi:hypothetical protein
MPPASVEESKFFSQFTPKYDHQFDKTKCLHQTIKFLNEKGYIYAPDSCIKQSFKAYEEQDEDVLPHNAMFDSLDPTLSESRGQVLGIDGKFEGLIRQSVPVDRYTPPVYSNSNNLKRLQNNSQTNSSKSTDNFNDILDLESDNGSFSKTKYLMQKKSLEDTIDTMKDTIAKLKADLAKSKGTQTEVVDELRELNAKLNADMKSLQTKLKTTTTKMNTVKDDLQLKVQELQKDMEDNKKQHKDKLDEREDIIKGLQKELESSKHSFNELQTSHNAVITYSSRIKTIPGPVNRKVNTSNVNYTEQVPQNSKQSKILPQSHHGNTWTQGYNDQYEDNYYNDDSLDDSHNASESNHDHDQESEVYQYQKDMNTGTGINNYNYMQRDQYIHPRQRNGQPIPMGFGPSRTTQSMNPQLGPSQAVYREAYGTNQLSHHGRPPPPPLPPRGQIQQQWQQQSRASSYYY